MKKHKENSKKNNDFWWSILAFCFPFLGLLLYHQWKKTKPRIAKRLKNASANGYLIHIGLFVLFLIIIGILNEFLNAP